MKVCFPSFRPARQCVPLVAALLVPLLVAAGCGRRTAAAKGDAPKRAPAASVRVAKVERRDVPFDVRAVGNAEAFSTVSIKSRVAGQLMAVRVREGEEVKAGATLFEIDPQPFQEKLRAAEAALARNRAQEQQSLAEIERARAQAANARAQWDRYQKLLQEGIAAPQQAEEVRSASLAANAQVNVQLASLESVRAAIRADESQIAQAKLELSYTTITAPVHGTAGFLQTKAGNLIRENDAAALLTLSQHSPMYVSFAVPEQHLREIRSYSSGGRGLVVEVIDEQGNVQATGRLAVMDNSVDSTTGTIKLKALFPNQDRRLWPGQFVQVRMKLRVDSGALTVPGNAVQTGPEGPYVWVMRADSTAELRKVTAVRTYGGLALLGKEMQEGETVVISGQLRVAPGTPLRVRQ